MSNALSRLVWITFRATGAPSTYPSVALPVYLHGTRRLGADMVVGAFNQVQAIAEMVVDNFAAGSDWRPALHRVAGFTMRSKGGRTRGGPGHQTRSSPSGALSLEFGVWLRRRVVISDATSEILPGERVLVVGVRARQEHADAAIAGLWPPGPGPAICRARANDVPPQRPYMPLGTLRRRLLSRVARCVSTEEIAAALDRTGLRISPPDEWKSAGQAMSLGQQQRSPLPLVVFHAGRGVLDEATPRGRGKQRGHVDLRQGVPDLIVDGASWGPGTPITRARCSLPRSTGARGRGLEYRSTSRSIRDAVGATFFPICGRSGASEGLPARLKLGGSPFSGRNRPYSVGVPDASGNVMDSAVQRLYHA